jgi:hypothetical protein
MDQNHYKLVAIDVDGTLLDSKHQVSPGAAQAVEMISDQGIHAVLVSGRSHYMLKELLASLRVSPYYIGSGGAIVATTAGEIIAYSPVLRSDAEEITRLSRQLGLGVCFHEMTQQKCEISDAQMRANLDAMTGSKISFIEDILANTGSAPEKITVFGQRPALEQLRLLLLALNLDISMVYSGPVYLEITRRGVSKGNALIKLAEHLNIPLENVAAIGDQQNDISMFEAVGLPIAMGNAIQEVKTAAAVIAPTNDEGGLAWALREVIGRQ